MTDPVPSKDLVSRITAYLSGGGLFNPELANHERVRDLLIECRDAFTAHEPKPAHEREPPHCSTCACGLAPEPLVGYVDPDLQATSAGEPEASNDWGVREAFKTIETYVTPGSAIPGAVLYLKREIRKLEKMVMEESARASQPPRDGQ